MDEKKGCEALNGRVAIDELRFAYHLGGGVVVGGNTVEMADNSVWTMQKECLVRTFQDDRSGVWAASTWHRSRRRDISRLARRMPKPGEVGYFWLAEGRWSECRLYPSGRGYVMSLDEDDVAVELWPGDHPIANADGEIIGISSERDRSQFPLLATKLPTWVMDRCTGTDDMPTWLQEPHGPFAELLASRHVPRGAAEEVREILLDLWRRDVEPGVVYDAFEDLRGKASDQLIDATLEQLQDLGFFLIKTDADAA